MSRVAYLTALAALLLVLACAVASARPHPATDVLRSPQGWPAGIGGR